MPRTASRAIAHPVAGPRRQSLLLALAAFGLAIALSLAVASPALAKSDKAKGHGNAAGNAGGNAGNNQGGNAVEQVEDRLEAEAIDAVLDGIFGENDRAIIERYYHDHPPNTQSLPPGIAKNVASGKPLPPGIAKKQLPGALERQLPPLAGDYERILVGDDVAIVRRGTEIIVDVLKDVLSR